MADRWIAPDDPLILQSRLAGRLAGDLAALRISLEATEEVPTARIGDRKETAAEMGVREVGETGRYDAHDDEVDDLARYDLHLTTAGWDRLRLRGDSRGHRAGRPRAGRRGASRRPWVDVEG